MQPNFEQPHESESEEVKRRRERWADAREQVAEFKDEAGGEMDEGIIDAVTALQLFEFPTNGSCEGHPERERGGNHPWVQVYASEPEGYENEEERRREWTRRNLKERQKMMRLLEEFYEERELNLHTQLHFWGIGGFGAFRLQSMGAELMELEDEEGKKEEHEKFLEEMDAFTAFLKEKYITEGKED